MRILCLTPWFPPAPGAQSGNFVLDSVLALKDAGHPVKVVVMESWRPALAGVLNPAWRRPRLQVERHDPALAIETLSYASIPRNWLRALSLQLMRWQTVPALQRCIREFRPDVVVAHTEYSGMVATAACDNKEIPTVVVLHGINTSARLNTPAEHQRLRDMFAAATRVVLVGESLRSHFAAIAGDSAHFRVVHNGVAMPAQVRPLQPWPTVLRFISVSNLHEGKGIDLTLMALARLDKTGINNWRYTIVGEGAEEKALRRLADTLGIRDKVDFIGAVPHSEVNALLVAADVFVLPSYREAFGVAWLEAMVCGLLAIAVEGQGPAAFIRDGDSGLLVAPRDVDSLERCLRRLWSEPDSMQRIAQQGRQRALNEFTWSAHASALVAVCEEAIGAGR